MVLIVNYGGGVNSTAMILGMMERDIKPDLIIFSDTGGERPETYAHLDYFDLFLQSKAYPKITRVHNVDKDGKRMTLEQNCLDNETLPSLAYGFKRCSLKFKKAPVDKFTNNWQPARSAWANGDRVTKALGIDAGESHRAKIYYDQKGKEEYIYPLIDWGWGRDECLEAIKRHGLKSPGKSSCFFCPAAKKAEILSLPKELLARALKIEKNAAPNFQTIKGLGRRFSWREFVESDSEQRKLFDGIYQDIPCDCFDGEEFDV